MASLLEMDRQCIWHPFTQMQTAPEPIPIVRANGPYLYAEDGSRYLDAISSWFTNLHGHTHPYIIQKIKEQAEQLEHVMFAGFTHAPAVQLASRLLSLLPGDMSKIFYSDNGSTAVESALKMALQYYFNKGIAKTKVICFKRSYFGDTFGAMSAAGKNEFNKPFWNHLFQVETIDPPTLGQEEASLSQLNAVLSEGEVACFIYEPLIIGVGGMIIYSLPGLNKLLQRCKEGNVISIADEVMTGFGRTGTLFASEQLHLMPDIICLSKGITGGFLPLGATACREDIYRAFLSDQLHHALLHGHTYTANPLACSSALASLDLLLENSCVAQREMIAECHREFCRSWSTHPRLKRCESLGTILVLEYRSDDNCYFDPIGRKLYRFFISQGILLRPFGNVLYMMPPYCIQKEQLDYMYEKIVSTLEGTI